MGCDPNLSFGLEQAQVTWTSSGTQEIVAGSPAANARLMVDSIILSASNSSGAGTEAAYVSIKSNTTVILGSLYLEASQVYMLGPGLNLRCNENEDLNITVVGVGLVPVGTCRVAYVRK